MGLFDIFLKKNREKMRSSNQKANQVNTVERLSNARDNQVPERTEAEKIVYLNAVETLRKWIIAEITERPATKYQLSSLLYQDAASCFPTNCSFKWDGAWFVLDLQTGRLSADVSTYPNQFGACREDSIALSASGFNRIAKQYNMKRELQAFQTDEDWAELFDDTLKAAVSTACTAIQRQNEKSNAEKVEQYAIRIPESYGKLSPDMDITEVDIELMQRYGCGSVIITIKNGIYQIVYERNSRMSSNRTRYSRELSRSEAVWLEKRIENTIHNPDNSTWHSLAGGDKMYIVIKQKKGKNISLRNVEPIKKYYELQDELEKLAQYGFLWDG